MLSLFLSVLDTEQKKSKFELIYNKYKKLVVYLALKEFNNLDTAEDVAGDVFEAIARNINCVDDKDEDKTKAFICTVTKYKIYDKKRKEKKYALLDTVFVTPEVKDNAFEKVYVKDVVACIEKLPEKYQSVLILKVYHGLSAEQIAKICGISKDNARKRIERARTMLSDILERGESQCAKKISNC